MKLIDSLGISKEVDSIGTSILRIEGEGVETFLLEAVEQDECSDATHSGDAVEVRLVVSFKHEGVWLVVKVDVNLSRVQCGETNNAVGVEHECVRANYENVLRVNDARVVDKTAFLFECL